MLILRIIGVVDDGYGKDEIASRIEKGLCFDRFKDEIKIWLSELSTCS
jgi:hypothetical protein